MKKSEEPYREESSPVARQERATTEVNPGQYNIRAVFPEDIVTATERTCSVSVVVLGPDDPEVTAQSKDPITRKTYSAGDKIVRYDFDGEPGAILVESLSFINGDHPFQELLISD